MPVVDKDIVIAIGVAADEVAGNRSEGNKTAVAADAGVKAGGISLAAAAVHGDAAGGACLPVVDKDVGGTIGVAADEVAGSGLEGNKTAVAADAGDIAVAIPLVTAAVHGDELDVAGGGAGDL